MPWNRPRQRWLWWQIDIVNRQLELLFGYSRDELLGQPIEMLIPERFRPDHSDLRASFFAEPQQRPWVRGATSMVSGKTAVKFRWRLASIRSKQKMA
jgi:PAS domain S-box-containing protein